MWNDTKYDNMLKVINWVKSVRIEPKAGHYGNCFAIVPKLQITYPPEWQREKGFAIEVGWGCWGAGLRFYNEGCMWIKDGCIHSNTPKCGYACSGFEV